ncbi:MAG: glycosyltransferase family 8 protein [Polyangiales bacterium]
MKTAYVSVVCNGDGYVPGIEVLGRSLDASGSRVPRVLLATKDISDGARGRLAKLGWEIREVEPIANPDGDRALFPRFASVFTKLRVWTLTDFDRVVLLDADTLVLQNIDDLFARRGFAAAPDFFLPDRFNSGVMVLEPSVDTFEAMVSALAVAGSYDGGDQGFLNTFYPDWYAMPAEHRLPIGYNMAHFIYQFLRGHPSLRARLERETKLVHYMVQKPWKARAVLTGGSDAWWKTYFEVHPDKAEAWRGKVHEFEDWTFDRLAALVLD